MSDAEKEPIAPYDRDHLPRAWTFDARGLADRWYFGEKVRPWDWRGLDPEATRVVWAVLEEFVRFFNERYVERTEQRIPPCWPEHGALVEEITTMCFARWQAFQSEHGTIGGAQYWHQYTVPGFLDRIGRWLGPDRLERCRQGRHEDAPDSTPRSEPKWEGRRAIILGKELAQREDDLLSGLLRPGQHSRIQFLDDKRPAGAVGEPDDVDHNGHE